MARVDPALMRLAAETVRQGDTVWDIGANLGLFSFAAAVAAGPSGRVLAVEPDTALAGLLRRSAAVNHGHAPVDVLPAAASDQEAVARFHIARITWTVSAPPRPAAYGPRRWFPLSRWTGWRPASGLPT
jgi:predicted RNA methylase